MTFALARFTVMRKYLRAIRALLIKTFYVNQECQTQEADQAKPIVHNVDFDESFYKACHADVEKAILEGEVISGYEHYVLHGKNENRLWSSTAIQKRFGIKSHYPIGEFAPTNMKHTTNVEKRLQNLSSGDESYILILISHLQKEVFYAGYTAFFEDFTSVFRSFKKVVLAVENDPFEPELARKYSDKIQVLSLASVYDSSSKPDVVVFLSTHLMDHARNFNPDLESTIYYCLEFEAGFFPYGVEYISAERAIAMTPNLIINTGLLKEDLVQRGLISDNRIFVTSPEIKPFNVAAERSNRLFFYYRPERFNTRNLPELIWESVHDFCSSNSGFELFLLGTVDTRFSFTLNGNDVYILNKLPYNQYIEIVVTCDVAVALIYSSHPGVIAFQTAVSGIPTVTNVFRYRDKECLRSISSNLIPYDPVRENLIDKINLGLTMTKGLKSFDDSRYKGENQESLTGFVMDTIKLKY